MKILTLRKFFFQSNLFVLICIGCISCIQKAVPEDQNENPSDLTIPEFKYLKGAEIKITEKDTLLLLKHPQNGTVYNSLNVRESQVFSLQSAVTISATHIPYFEMLDQLDVIKGMAHPEYSLSSTFAKRVKDDLVQDVSGAQGADFEKTMACDPDAFFIYPFGTSDYSRYEELGIAVINITEYLEQHPLAKAEWIKVFGLFLNEEEKAEQIFEAITTSYLQIKSKKSGHASTAFFGEPFKGQWNQPSGSSYMSHLLKDAGYQYIWKDSLIDKNLELSFEEVYNNAIDADYWFLAAPKKKNFALKDLINEDARYKNFKSVQDGNVYLCNTAEVDYFGSGTLEPQVILKDLISASEDRGASGKYFVKLKD